MAHDPAPNRGTMVNASRPTISPLSPGVAVGVSLLVFAAAAAVAGCSNQDPADGPQPTNSTPSTSIEPSADPAGTEAQQAAVAAYTGYIDAYARAAQAGDPDDPNLVRYVTDPLLGATRRALRTLRDNGQVQRGAQSATVLTSRVDLTSPQPTVVIRSCLDYTGLSLVYRSNQSPVPNSTLQKQRITAESIVWRYATGQWLVNDTKQVDGLC